MTIVFVVTVLVSSVWVLWPLFQNKFSADLVDQQIHPIDALQTQKQNLLQSIRELDFDFETGKVSSDDYQQIRANLEAQTVEVLKKMESAQKHWEEIEGEIK